MDITGLPKFTIRGELRSGGGAFLPGAPSTSADDVRDFINANPEAKALVFEFSSTGGSLNQGFEMHDLIKGVKQQTIGIGYTVCSATVLPFIACSKRLVTENVSFVIHPARIPTEFLGTDALTASDLQELSQSVQIDDKKIMDAYCATIGEDKRSKVLAYFSQETDLGAKGAIKMGFAQGYWKKKISEPSANELVFAVDGFTEERFSNSDISKYLSNKIMEKTEIKALHDKQSVLEKALNGLRKMVGLMKNDAILSDASGVVVGTIVSPDDNLQGKPAVAYDEAGLPTADPLPDGPYTDDKGRTVNIKGGMVESVANGLPPAGDQAKENEVLKKKIADLEAAAGIAANEKTALTNKVKELEASNKTVADSVAEVQNQFNEFKKLVPGAPKEKAKDDDEPTADEWKNMTHLQRLQATRMNFKKATTI